MRSFLAALFVVGALALIAMAWIAGEAARDLDRKTDQIQDECIAHTRDIHLCKLLRLSHRRCVYTHDLPKCRKTFAKVWRAKR